VATDPYALSLAPYSFLWLELQPPAVKSETLVDSTLDPSPTTFEEQEAAEVAALELMNSGWSGFLSGKGQAAIESAISEWLPRQRWFGAKTRKIQSVKLMEWVELPHALAGHLDSYAAAIPPALFFFEINYGDNATDVYQIPLAFSTGEAAAQVRADRPIAIVATLPTQAGDGVLFDGTVLEDLRQAVLALIERGSVLELSHPLGSPARAGSAVDSASGPVSGFGALNEDLGIESASLPHPLAGSPVEPLPLTAQPGEAAAPPRAEGQILQPPSPQRLQPRESPSAGDPEPRKGVLQGKASTAFPAHLGTHPLPSRLGSAEQSNTSILYGKQLILKLFRRLQAGENPDVEIGRFFTEVAHFKQVAPFLGQIDITPAAGEKATVAMLQGLVANEGDGWEWFLDQLAQFFEQIAELPPPVELPVPTFLANAHVPQQLRETAETTLAAAALLGQRSAEMHLALATPTADPAFAAEPFSAEDLKRDSIRIQDQITSAVEALKTKFVTLPDEVTGDAAVLLTRRRELLDRARTLASGEPGGKRIRIHGDYHLGQTLRTRGHNQEGDFVLLDFEGEPARPLSERRRKQSPLRDVAGMVRSFSYAAHSALTQHLVVRESASVIDLRAWARLWENAASAEFLRAYRTTIAADPSLLPPPQRAQALFASYLLEKALYELLYELNNRPAWLQIPIAGILAI
jgi:maltose alpha-D-glucosyltransferase/alpha-amylase